MRGYDVITSDGEKMGHVVGTDGSILLVERGTIRKSRYAVPRAVAHTNQAESEVRLTVSKEIVEAGPKVNGNGVDEKEVAEYYGIVDSPEAQADTGGYGEVVRGDPARGAEQDAARAGVETADERRARIREEMRPEGDTGPDVGVQGSALYHDTSRAKE